MSTRPEECTRQFVAARLHSTLLWDIWNQSQLPGGRNRVLRRSECMSKGRKQPLPCLQGLRPVRCVVSSYGQRHILKSALEFRRKG